MNHKMKILEYMKGHGSITQQDAYMKLGCTRLAARIKDLRGEGYQIMTEMTEGTNRDGDKTRFAIYYLVKGAKAE